MRHPLRRRSPGVLGLIALVGLGLVATLLAVQDERAQVRRTDVRASELAASRISGALLRTVGTLRGVDSLAVDGDVDAVEFEAFARDVLTDSLFSALAYAIVLADDDRASFEASSGITITDTDGAGGFVPAEPRPRSVVVVDVQPLTEETRQVLGFDLAGDPIRARAADAADATSAPVISDRTLTATEARVGISVMQAVTTPDGATIGYITSGLVVESLIERAGVDPSAFAGFSMSMDGQVLAGGGPSGASSTFEVAGRRFEITVDEGASIGLLLPIALLAGTVLLAAAVWTSIGRDRAQRDQLASIARRNRAIAELGRALAASSTSTGVIDEVVRHAGVVIADAHVTVARRSGDSADALVVDRGDGTPVPLDRAASSGPLIDCIDSATAIVVADAGVSDGSGLHTGSFVCVPLMFSDDFCFGAIEFVWDDAITAHEADDRAVAATTVAELCSRALERAVITEIVQSGVDNLSTFARALAGAHTAADVATAVRHHAGAILGAAEAELDIGADMAGTHRTTIDTAGATASDVDDLDEGRCVERPILDREGETVARLTVRWRAGVPPSTTRHAVLATLTDLVAQTLARTSLVEQEHHIIVQLQRDLLPTPPTVDGLEIAVRYEPAMNIVGLGGDFYDVIVSDGGRVYLVIGDITGHGSEAVAAMAELNAVINHQLRADTPIADVCVDADLVLARRDVLGTAQILEVDLGADSLRYVNAGHPYPVLRHAAGGTDLFVDGRRVMLGLDHAEPVQVPCGVERFVVGDTLLLYTDGLIERRHQNIDDAIAELRTSVGGHPSGTADDLLARLLDDDHMTGADDRIDDDIALVAVRRLA